MIKQLRLRHFKGHQDTTIQLGQLTALVGPNSAGKTSLLQALSSLRCLEEAPAQGFRGEFSPTRLVRKGESFLSWELQGVDSSTQKPWEFTLELRLPKEPKGEWESWSGWFWGGERMEVASRPLDEIFWASGLWGDVLRLTAPVVFRENLCRSVYLKMQASLLAEVSFSSDEIPRVAYDGRYLASAIAYLKTYEEEAFDRLQTAVQRVLPHVERLRVKRTKREVSETRYVQVEHQSVPLQETRMLIGDELVFDLRGVGEIAAQDISEGTLLAVGLLTVLMSPSCPNLVLFDDLEQALHPKAQRALVKVLKEILEEREDLQIVVTTHSPYIVDAFEPSAVYVMAMNEQGEVKACSLDKHPNASRFLDIFTTGEFLSAEGEDWVLESGVGLPS